MVEKNSDSLEKTMNDVKMLLVLQLLLSGAKQSDIAQMLGVSEATISRLIPKAVKTSMKAKNNG